MNDDIFDNVNDMNDGNDETEHTGTENEEVKSAKSDESSSIGSDIIRGHINTIILRALYERDKYGYEIMNDIEQKSHGQYSLKQPTLYSALKRLENQGYIKAYWKTDEVSSGGRRKYFTLTESGKEITEKNLAEWEYSRTIIDSLISDRSFDFSNPAPTPVDFTILRNSVSRVPVVRNAEDEESDGKSTEVTEPKAEETTASENTEPVVSERVVIEEQIIEQVVAEQPVIQERTEEPTVSQQFVQQEQVTEQPAQQTVDDERRRVHENYMRLISEPVREEQPVVDDIVPNSENVNTDSLIYNNRPETERDYKNLIDGIFKKAITNGSVQTTYTRAQPEPRPQVEETRHIRLVDRGRADGVTVATSSNFDANSTYATKTTYNKGLTLFKCSAIILAITAIEFIFCFVFLNQLNTTWVYPSAILLLGLIQFAVFGIIALQGHGKNCVRPTTNGYISTCVILTIISILIISALAFILNINPNSASDIMKMIVIPSITALNITVFALFFKLFLKN